MNEELEMLNLDELSFEEVCRKLSGFPFPAITVGEHQIYCNIMFKNLLNGETHIRLYTTPEYVIIEPLSSGDYANSFKIHKMDNAGCAFTIPVYLREKKLQKGFYKIYKCKKGYAFKRYEQLGDVA